MLKRLPIIRDIRGYILSFKMMWRVMIVWNLDHYEVEDLLADPRFSKDTKHIIAVFSGRE